jgi:hypothetical protein
MDLSLSHRYKNFDVLHASVAPVVTKTGLCMRLTLWIARRPCADAAIAMLPPLPPLCHHLQCQCSATLPPHCLLPATAAAALPPLPHCCRAAFIALPLPLLLSCLSTHNEVNEWVFIKPMNQYNNQQKTMFQYNSQQNDGLMNGHSLNTMTPYNNQQ